MALRPVSELGLVEVTDVAAPPAQPRRRSHRPRQQQSASPDQTPAAPSPAPDPGPVGSHRAAVATSVLSGAVGVAGAVLVGRAILRR
jgi:hypothetical protein